jgi:hypothetical protein
MKRSLAKTGSSTLKPAKPDRSFSTKKRILPLPDAQIGKYKLLSTCK